MHTSQHSNQSDLINVEALLIWVTVTTGCWFPWPLTFEAWKNAVVVNIAQYCVSIPCAKLPWGRAKCKRIGFHCNSSFYIPEALVVMCIMVATPSSAMELKQDSLESAGMTRFVSSSLVSVPDPKPTPARIAFSILRVILEAIYAPGEVWDETTS